MNWLAAGRAGFGLAALAMPDTLGGRLAGVRLTNQARWAVRILGARQLLQAVVCAPAPTRCLVQLEAVVDGVHAGTMATVAVLAHHHSTRRAAAANVVGALGFMVADLVMANSARVKDVGGQGNRVLLVRDRLAQQVNDYLRREARMLAGVLRVRSASRACRPTTAM
jgi:hypothetical protein